MTAYETAWQLLEHGASRPPEVADPSSPELRDPYRAPATLLQLSPGCYLGGYEACPPARSPRLAPGE